MDYTRLRFSSEGPIARLVLSRADHENAIDARCLRELEDAAARIADDAAVLVTIVCAEGASFCRGWDPSLLPAGAGNALDVFDPFGVLTALPGPVIAAVQGDASSAGLELALACDIRLAATNARFALPDLSEGRLPLAGGSQRLPRVVGRGRALAMLLAGEVLDAPAALKSGLVNEVFAVASLEQAATALATRIASRGPLAVRFAKELLQRGPEMTLDQALRYETDLSVILQTTADRVEGVRAFFEKRPPNFRGL
jgi:enoyl-CoA hydratase